MMHELMWINAEPTFSLTQGIFNLPRHICMVPEYTLKLAILRELVIALLMLGATVI